MKRFMPPAFVTRATFGLPRPTRPAGAPPGSSGSAECGGPPPRCAGTGGGGGPGPPPAATASASGRRVTVVGVHHDACAVEDLDAHGTGRCGRQVVVDHWTEGGSLGPVAVTGLVQHHVR